MSAKRFRIHTVLIRLLSDILLEQHLQSYLQGILTVCRTQQRMSAGRRLIVLDLVSGCGHSVGWAQQKWWFCFWTRSWYLHHRCGQVHWHGIGRYPMVHCNWLSSGLTFELFWKVIKTPNIYSKVITNTCYFTTQIWLFGFCTLWKH